jgi:hypothetical protein
MIVLTGCSGSTKHFDARGLVAPPAQCAIEPDRFGIAEQLRPIDEGNGCRVPNPWRIDVLAGVRMSQPATVNCGLASPLADWLDNVVQPSAQARFGESVREIQVAASYSCRPRNNRWGARMSEHGFGNAIDIAGFKLESGSFISVQDAARRGGAEAAFIGDVREAACGEFMTVLGPGADRHHKDHIHLDLQMRRSGRAYCR